jgi:arylsulfatase A-like enzyme
MEETAQVDNATSRPHTTARSILALAALFGLVGGYLDVLLIYLKKDVFHASMYFNQGRNFAWTVPLGHLAILVAVGAIVAAIHRLRPGLFPLRAVAWLLATLALWVPLLRTPVAGAASLVLAAGLARWISRPFSTDSPGRRRFARVGLASLAGALVLSAAVSLGWQGAAESRAVARLPEPARGAKNVLLLVLDTVRAESLSLHGYSRETTPNLARWAKKGVRFDRAIATAPWTLPSHGSFFTGQWPYKLNLHWQGALDPTTPTLAGFLGSRGYQAAGFAANTNNCSYETGLDRGFSHYEDYPLTPRSILRTNAVGRWLLKNTLDRGDAYALKWDLLQSRGAHEINRAFLDWLSHQRSGDRPFFAFLNYLDAHEPFVLPESSGPRFGLRPESARDIDMLIDYWELDKLKLAPRDVTLARDAYDDCIAHLDREVGSLLDTLEGLGVLKDTLVIITSDHGEEFGEHGVFNHGYSLYRHAVQVPLVVIPPATTTAGHVVSEPVSLRDLPATVVDLLGLPVGSPFPGRSLAGLWGRDAGADRDPVSPALSEVSAPPVLPASRGRGPAPRGFAMSLVAGSRHYFRDSFGAEALFDWDADPSELHDLKNSTDGVASMSRLQESILRVLAEDPATTGLSSTLVPRFAKPLEARVGAGTKAIP